MTTPARPGFINRALLTRAADAAAVAVAVSLPWSTSATSLLVVVWLVVLLPTLRLAELRRELASAAGGLPVLLLLFGIAGMLWADVALIERWRGLDSFLKLMAIPLLFIQFRRSERGLWIFGGYLAACTALLLASAFLSMTAGPWWPNAIYGVPVKNEATQSGEFVTCIFGLLFLAVESFTRRQWLWLLGFFIVILAMLMNIFFVATGRTALVLILVLLALFAMKQLSRGGILILFACTIAIGAMAWTSSPYLRGRIVQIWTDFQSYEATDERNSSGERIEFWKKSVAFIREAPIIGHGTGSMPALFTKSAIGQTGVAAASTTNPHNQTFAVAIQLGLIGAGVLWAMWIAHLLLFRGSGLVEWIGLVVVVQNIVGSLFNSHLFDFTQSWVYVFGVGVAGGMVLKRRSPKADAGSAMTCAMNRIDLPSRPRILVVALRRLGDVLLSTSLIRSLRRAWPDATIDALVFADTAGILAGNPDLNGVVVMPPRPTTGQGLILAAKLWRRYDLAISTQCGDRPTFFAAIAGRLRVGPFEPSFSGRVKRIAFHRSMPIQPGVHRVEEILRLADLLGIARVPELVAPRGADANGMPAGPYAVIHAAPMFCYKQWTRQGWRELAAALAARGLMVIATGGPGESERRYLDDVWSGAPVRRLDGQLDWPQLGSLLAKARIYVGPDTSVTHLAAASGCVTVALYGPTDPRLWGPWPVGGLPTMWDATGRIQQRGNVRLVQNVLPCMPCQLEGCERRLDSYSQCLDELPAAQVIAAVDQALETSGETTQSK